MKIFQRLGYKMSYAKLCRHFLVIFLFTFISLHASDQELLQPKDINKIMKQIFDQHVDKKEMSSSILKHSFKIYIDQFDPERLYLTQQEVAPFLQLDDASMTKIMNQYHNNQFPEYTDLNQAIQKAIIRSRKMRQEIEKNQALLFKSSSSYTPDNYEEWRDPDLKRLFVDKESDLKERWKQYIIEFIAKERSRYGDSLILNHQDQTLHLFEKQVSNHENQYLFVNENGQPMNEAEKQNAFTMHVLKALANSLDSHTTVLNSVEAYDMRIRLEKEIEGIGVLLEQKKDGDVLISQLLDKGPAAKSGLVKVNDQILEINGKPVRSESIEHIMEMLRGKNGSKVSLTLQRLVDEGAKKINKTFNIQLTRESIFVNEDRVQSSYETFGNGIIGKIKLDSFYQGENGITSENDVRDAIKKLDKQGNLRGLILDLRENSGGFLSQAVKVVGLFITNGVVVISKYFNGEEHIYRDMDSDRIYDGPLVILTSKATASAAEIVAQSLQDYGVAIVVGDEHTYGKGTIQSQTVTENQGSTYFKVTVGKYYTVSGKTPQIQGVHADIVVPSQFAHENIGEEYLEYPLQQDTITSKFDDKLEDISPNLKPWYLHYYVPTLQHRKALWQNILPILKKNSAYRIAQNKDYQMFLKGSSITKASQNSQQNFGVDDLQMNEAANIIKDMIILHSKFRGSQTIEATPTLQAGLMH